jgi:hypothetical protein
LRFTLLRRVYPRLMLILLEMAGEVEYLTFVNMRTRFYCLLYSFVLWVIDLKGKIQACILLNKLI